MKDAIVGYLENNYEFSSEDNLELADLVESYVIQYVLVDIIEAYFEGKNDA
jgi:hypothetical protein